MRIIFLFLLACVSVCAQAANGRTDTFRVDYTVTFEPALKSALVHMHIDEATYVPRLDFRIRPQRYSDFRADGSFSIQGNRGIWLPPKGAANLRFRVRIDHQRRNGGYDARITQNWAIVRGDDLVPPAKARIRVGMKSVSHLTFVLPAAWPSVETGWMRIGEGRFLIDNPETRFDRPTGWIIAGKIATRRDMIGNTQIAISAPLGEELRRMDLLTFVNFLWPHIQRAWNVAPGKVLLVSANDPMWRGGLSGPNSLFLHADRPLVSENGTSALLHELTHVLTRIRGTRNDDWIAEGIAEFYAIELLRRAGGMTQERHQQTYAWLLENSAQVTTLRVRRAHGAVTARAVLLLAEIDRELRRRSGGRRSLDDVVRALIKVRKVSNQAFIAAVEKTAGGKLKLFESPLVQ